MNNFLCKYVSSAGQQRAWRALPFIAEGPTFSGGISDLKQFGNFVLDIANECLWSGRTQINMPPKPFAVLRYLVDNPGRLITHRELLGALWPATYVQPQVLRTHMLELRKILGDDAGQPRSMITNRLDKKYANSLAAEEQVKAGE